jgi:hypothetical protein
MHTRAALSPFKRAYLNHIAFEKGGSMLVRYGLWGGTHRLRPGDARRYRARMRDRLRPTPLRAALVVALLAAGVVAHAASRRLELEQAVAVSLIALAYAALLGAPIIGAFRARALRRRFPSAEPVREGWGASRLVLEACRPPLRRPVVTALGAIALILVTRAFLSAEPSPLTVMATPLLAACALVGVLKIALDARRRMGRVFRSPRLSDALALPGYVVFILLVLLTFAIDLSA